MIFDAILLCDGCKTLSEKKYLNLKTPQFVRLKTISAVFLILSASIQFNNPQKENCTLTLYNLHGQVLRTIENKKFGNYLP